MKSLLDKIAKLSPEQRKIFEAQLRAQKIDIFDQPDLIKANSFANIPAVEPRDFYPLSRAQKRLYILNELEQIGTGYNISGAMTVAGELDRGRIQSLLQHLVDRHESFRTCFRMVDGEPAQIIEAGVTIQLTYEAAAETDLAEKIQAFIRPFELDKAPLLRAGLWRLGPAQHLLIFDMHHIIADGASLAILTREFIDLYEGKPLPALRIQYKDYSAWQSQADACQNELLPSESLKVAEAYWLKQYEGELPVLNLPLDYPRPAVQSFAGDQVSFEAGPELSQGLKQLGAETGATLYMILLAAWNVLLYRYTGQEDIIVGAPIAGRYHADLENIIGMFVNTLALRNFPAGEKRFRDFLLEVKETALAAYEHQEYPFEELVEKLAFKRDLSRNPLFDTVVVLQNTEMNSLAAEGLKFSPYSFESHSAKFDLTLNGTEIDDRICFGLEYCTKLFHKGAIENLAGHFLKLLAEVTREVEIRLQDIDLLTPAERQSILDDFNRTQASYPREKTIHQLFEEQVIRTPDLIAVAFADRRITYRELNEKANQLARRLRDKGVQPDHIVGIMVERSPEMIIGILGILKAGGAYLPIDPEYPGERINFMLADSGALLLLTQPHLTGKVKCGAEMIDLTAEAVDQGADSNPPLANRPRDLAYIIYTSGTTGKPKGVMIEHQNVVRLLFNDRFQFHFGQHDVWTMFHSYCFDFSVWEMYGALLYGGRLIIVPKIIAQDTHEFLGLLTREQVTVLNQTPGAFDNLISEALQGSGTELSALKYIIFGGEALRPGKLKQWRHQYPGIKLINMYGITETTVHVTYKEINAPEIDLNISNIGRPIPTLTTYIMDQSQQIQPIGVAGELWVGGEGVGRGYLNRPELTAEKFLVRAFRVGAFRETPQRLYRTGDLARWLPDGDIEFLGRIDQQVKIRGYRIELGEIEARLLSHHAIQEALVAAKEDQNGAWGGDKYLCAWFTGAEELAPSEIRAYLSQTLPDYMIPSYFIHLEKFPLTANGKVDRKAIAASSNLPEPEGRMNTGAPYVAPRNDTEIRLTVLWQEILGIQRIGVHDNFFDLGGHSLKATALVLRIHQEFKVELQLRELFKTPTIAQISEYIRRTSRSGYESIPVISNRSHYPLSSAQKRLYILNELEQTGTGYNIPVAMTVAGELDREHFQRVLQQLINRHESFRTCFRMVDGEPAQIIEAGVTVELAYEEAAETELAEKIQAFIRPFELDQAPLLRAGLWRLGPAQYFLIFDMHHIIADGASLSILTREFIDLYEGKQLPALRIQYKDYAAWQSHAGAWQNQADAWQRQAEASQNDLLPRESLKQAEAYWLKQYEGEAPVLNLPLDYPRPAVQSFAGDQVSFEAGPELSRGLKQLGAETGATLYMVLLAAWNVLLYRYTGQEDIIVGSPIAGRYHAELEKIIGMFVNTLALRSFPSGEKRFRDFLLEVRETALAAYEHQEYPFEELVEKLSLKRDLSRNALFDVMFVLQNMDNETVKIRGAQFRPYPVRNAASKFDLTLTATENDGGIGFTLEYCVKLFQKETVQRMGQHFLNLLETLRESPEITLQTLEILTITERETIFHQFNDTRREYPNEKTISQLFEEQVERTPDHIAVIFEDQTLTYRELNAKANILARVLQNHGLGRESVAGLLLTRSLEMSIGIMAVLKAGGAYLPISPEYPRDRIKFLLSDSGAAILLTKDFDPGFDAAGKAVPIIRLKAGEISTGDASNLKGIHRPHDPAYIIYTSGSTGKPKGVVVEHGPLINRLHWMQKQYPISAGDRILQKTPYTFDVSVWELLWGPLQGAAVCFLAPGGEKDPRAIVEAIAESQISTIHFVPSMLNAFLNWIENGKEIGRLKSLKRVFASGEALTAQQVKRFNRLLYQNHGTTLHNLYGPTEAAIDVSYFDCSTVAEPVLVPIGKPIDNIRFHVLDRNHRIQPVGIAGELHIAGAGLARGYLNRPELTAEKFFVRAFRETPQRETPPRIYKTGDLVRWLPDGNVEFLGRMDHQVKIRGYRIELEEIEARLLGHPAIGEALVVAAEDQNGPAGADGDKYLCAYYTGTEGLALSEIRAYLSQTLPDYMIPSYFMRLEKLPLTANGKIDRNALPSAKPAEPDGRSGSGIEYIAPGNETETKLLALWQEILGIQRIGVHDNFFDLGGHSLKATALISRIHQAFNIELPLRSIFLYPTIKEQAAFLQRSAQNLYQVIRPVGEWPGYPPGCFPVSSAQKRLYILHQLEKGLVHYNMPGALIFEGGLDRERLEAAFRELIRRHESLRTSFEVFAGLPVQRIHPQIEFRIDKGEDSNLEGEDSNPRVQSVIRQFIRPFDLSQAPLLRVGLLELSPRKHLLIYDMHHIISDGVSLSLIIQEFIARYLGRELPDLPIQYKDYAVWQNEQLQDPAMEQQKAYWIQCFFDEVPILHLPTDFPRPAVRSFTGGQLRFDAGPDLTGGIDRVTAVTRTTPFSFLLAVFNILLSKYSGQEDIVIGSPIAGRRHADLENIIGMFVNTLALRNYPSSEKTFTRFLAEVQENSIQAFENQDYPFEELVESLELRRDLSRNPLFDVMLVLHNEDPKALETNQLQISVFELKSDISKFDITLNAQKTEHGLKFALDFCRNLFQPETIQRFANHLLRIIAQIIANPDITLAELSLLSAMEKRQILEEFNNTTTPCAPEKTLHEIFEEQVARTPDQIAVIFKDTTLTYRELNAKANSLARVLQSHGLGRENIAGLLLGRSPEMIIGIMAVLKAGGAYLPLDPGYPPERVRYLLEDSNAAMLLTEERFRSQLQFSGPIVNLEDQTLYQGADLNIPAAGPQNLAYVIYTSGTTGRPKGVLVEHRSIAHNIQWRKREYGFGNNDVSLQLFSYVFDGFLTSFFTPLISGAKVAFLPDEEANDPLAVKRWITAYQVTHFISVPSFYLAILQALTSGEAGSLRIVTLAGERTTAPLLERSKEKNPALELVNEYGPTESTVVASIYRDMQPGATISIGKPIANTRIYILNKFDQLQLVGIPGELCIAGAGLARGYLNQPELTAEKFFVRAFRETPQRETPQRIYRTGDLAQWAPDGNIEYLGRMDSQIKIRGYRIELGEIETGLLRQDKVKEAAVVARETPLGETYLGAYVVGEGELEVNRIKDQLARELPPYMIPRYIMQLARMPMSRNGKLDREQLPAPDSRLGSEAGYAAPETELESQLARIWMELLEIGQVGINDNFFELGGHSLKANTMVLRIMEELNITVTLQDVFQHQTIRTLANAIANRGKSLYQPIQPAPGREHYPCSSAQIRTFAAHQHFITQTSYNMPGILLLEGELDRFRLENAFYALIERHESFRTSFELRGGEPVQIIAQAVPFRMDYCKYQSSFNFELEQALITEEMDKFIQPFDLSQAPLLRVKLIELAPTRYLLLFDLHHIIADGDSMNIMIEDLAQLYHGQKLPDLPVQYKDFTLWQNDFFNSEAFRRQEQYWLERFSGDVPILELPVDHPRPSIRSYEGDHLHFEIGPDLVAALNKLALETDSTLFMVLLAAYNILLAKYSGTTDMIIGTNIAGRSHPDLKNIIGMFTNTLAFRNFPRAELGFRDFLAEVRHHALEGYDHQDYPFEKLPGKLNLQRDPSRSLLVETVFSFQNFHPGLIPLPGLKMTPYEFERKMARLDLLVILSLTGAGLHGIIEYSTRIFKPARIERLKQDYLKILEQIVRDPQIKLGEIRVSPGTLVAETDVSQITTGEFDF